MIITIIVFVLLVLGIYMYLQNENREKANYEILASIRNLYKSLLAVIISSYDLKICPKCYEKHMDLLTVSPTGQSIEYKCMHCNKKITSKILPNKDGSEAVRLFNEVKRKVASLERPLSDKLFHEDAQTDFIVNNENDSFTNKEYRQSIPESVRHEVWRRDQGRCVSCGSQINIEFDHIIPISKGGSNTARNLQLLCEICNRKKSAKI
jgi:hypothetical protein